MEIEVIEGAGFLLPEEAPEPCSGTSPASLPPERSDRTGMAGGGCCADILQPSRSSAQGRLHARAFGAVQEADRRVDERAVGKLVGTRTIYNPEGPR
jgi:hypothetical protein